MTTNKPAKKVESKAQNEGMIFASDYQSKVYNLDIAPKFGKEQYIKWHYEMLLMRRFEEKAGQMYGMQKIRGFCHLYIGQEAVVAGTVSALKQGDKMITAYRDHAHAIGCGITPREVMAELYGKVTGCSKGRGGSMHMFSKEKNFFGGHGIVGAQIPMGAGIAFADKYKGLDNVFTI
jgi:pyruvate dehydrogenase E1 component alpha subunit